MDKVKYVEVVKLRKGQLVFSQGDAADCMYLVNLGRVGIYADYGGVEERLLKRLEPGSYFGEMGMVRGVARSATAVALEQDTTVSIITWEQLGGFFRENPSRVIRIMQQLGQRVNELSDDYMDACGAVAELVAQCGSLRGEIEDLRRESDALRQALARGERRQAPPDASPDAPRWTHVPGESEKAENARFRKYMDEYRRYKTQIGKEK